MRKFFQQGLDLRLPGAPRQAVSAGNSVRSVAVFGRDYRGIKPKILVKEGQIVTRGTPLFHDRSHPEIVVTAPVGGEVLAVEIGAKRKLSHIEISSKNEQQVKVNAPTRLSAKNLAALMQETGLWPGFTERPFGKVPAPHTRPDAIFVTATKVDPQSVHPDVVLSQSSEAFTKGMTALKHLTKGPVFLCQGAGPHHIKADKQIRPVAFDGPYLAGLSGTHIDRLFPVLPGRKIWQIYFQDVIALGMVLLHGTLPGTEVVALSGPCLKNPRLVQAPRGANLSELLAGELTEGDKTVLSGSVLTGTQSRFLRARHWQVSVVHRPAHSPARASKPARPRPIIPTRALAGTSGVKLPLVPLLRALSVGDHETAQKLGCLALLEEDLALPDYASGGMLKAGQLLRAALDKLEAQA